MAKVKVRVKGAVHFGQSLTDGFLLFPFRWNSLQNKLRVSSSLQQLLVFGRAIYRIKVFVKLPISV